MRMGPTPRTLQTELVDGTAAVKTGVTELGTTVLRTKKTGRSVGKLPTALGWFRSSTHISITFGLREVEHACENMTPITGESEM